MDQRTDEGRSSARRHPLRRLSSIGQGTTGWRSSLETGRHESIASFIVGTLVAAAAFLGLVIFFLWLGG